MSTSTNQVMFRNDEPAVYSIRVAGILDESWSGRLGGMSIANSTETYQTQTTTLSGLLMDQAALFGVLNALYNMHLPVLSVECMDCK